ncbi:MAG: precorrin-6Y C5,15-methyltransferase (decarboxylating) subunit CbiT [Selenomonadaceae bacterium]|nr:precorrin-6Y C5,15-methyltransferase (decarboxylating) subunit CbiT [Selenomonadaceae bacterium]MBQ1913734.1 precorrin-6Y C5,15-methyltransferase (decarboxylating) subunit CbiT [Selenomonadaceae bacterium]
MYHLGIDDGEFIRGTVPMTKQEIRILTLAKAHLEHDSVIYDVGAGTGSLSIEAALQSPDGHVYAVERNPEGVRLIRENARKFQAENITILQAEAPDGMEDLPECDTVLIGGSGGNLVRLFDALDGKLRQGGRIILNCITVQTLMQCIAYMREKEGYTYEAVQVQVSRLQQVGAYDMAKALNPIYIVTCVKKSS